MDIDFGHTRITAGRHVLDAFGRRDTPLQGFGHETLHRAGAGARVDGTHPDQAFFHIGKLADRELAGTLQAQHQQQAAHHDRKHRAPDEEIGELHR